MFVVKIPMNRPSVWAKLTFEEKPLFFEIFSKHIAFKCHGLHLKTPIKTSPNSSSSYLLFALLVAVPPSPPPLLLSPLPAPNLFRDYHDAGCGIMISTLPITTVRENLR